jgi:hypothetical protein
MEAVLSGNLRERDNMKLMRYCHIDITAGEGGCISSVGSGNRYFAKKKVSIFIFFSYFDIQAFTRGRGLVRHSV